jgi:hypothetical protein
VRPERSWTDFACRGFVSAEATSFSAVNNKNNTTKTFLIDKPHLIRFQIAIESLLIE